MEPNHYNRRQLLMSGASVLGMAALSSLSNPNALAGVHFPPRAKRIIWLTQSGAPSQIDLFDWKPDLQKQFNKDLPESVRGGQRLTGMTADLKRLPIAPSMFRFTQHGQCGRWISELLPHTAKIVDEISFVHSMHTDAINHDPAMTLIQTGHAISGRPSMGAWLSYGLGSDNVDLPTYTVLISRPSGNTNAQPLHERNWGAGFLPTKYQGVRFSPGRDPLMYLSNPDGMSRDRRRAMLDRLKELNTESHAIYNDPEINARIDQFEMAYRLQSSVPELSDLSKEDEKTFERYGPESRKPGTYAANCILARRLAERNVRFIQLIHRGWDQHDYLPRDIRSQCYDTDQPTAALISDLKQRGLLDDTLVVWGGEFGRTTYSQGRLTTDNYGRDHHPRCFTIWMAGAGIKPGTAHGQTDDFSYNIVEKPVHIHDLNATMLYAMGIDHERLTFRFQGRDFRLTDVHGHVLKDWFA